MAELEGIVQRMEQSQQPLQQIIEDFERGMTISKHCQKSLDEAQQRVDVLMKRGGDYQLEPLDDGGAESNDENSES